MPAAAQAIPEPDTASEPKAPPITGAIPEPDTASEPKAPPITEVTPEPDTASEPKAPPITEVTPEPDTASEPKAPPAATQAIPEPDTTSEPETAAQNEIKPKRLVFVDSAARPKTDGGPRRHRRGKIVLAALIVAAAVGAVLIAMNAVTPGKAQFTPIWTSTDGIAWQRVEEFDAGGGYSLSIESVAAGGPGFVAVGSDRSDAGTVWTSADGRSWSVAADAQTLLEANGLRDQYVSIRFTAIIATDTGMLMAGTMTEDRVCGDASIWASSDGSDWSLVWREIADYEPIVGSSIRAMVETASGAVAVGEINDCTFSGADAAVWISDQDRSWERVDLGVVAGTTGEQLMDSVAADASGITAVGWDCGEFRENDENPCNAGAWFSQDGQSWSRVPHNEGTFGGNEGQFMHDVVRVESGFVAAGFDNAVYGPGAWISDTGEIWQRVAHHDGLGGDNRDINALTEFEGTVIAVGGGACQAEIWTSSTGSNWSHEPPLPTLSDDSCEWANDIATGDGTALIVGYNS